MNNQLYIENLDAIGKTLLIPLWVRYKDYIADNPLVGDKYSYEIVKNMIDNGDFNFDDFEILSEKIKQLTILGISTRTMIIDKMIIDFINKHNKPVIINLGCGLDTRSIRLAHKKAKWINIDVRPTIKLRDSIFRKIGINTINSIDLSHSIYDFSWIENIKENDSYKSRDLLFLSEGTLMYFNKAMNLELIYKIEQSFNDITFILEILGLLASGHSHPFIKKLGLDIKYKWGQTNTDKIFNNSIVIENKSIFDIYQKQWGILGALVKILPFLKRRISSYIVMAKN